VIPHMKPFPTSLSLSLSFALAATTSLWLSSMPSTLALEASPAAPMVSSDFAVDSEDKDHDGERKEIESILSMIETQWNAHDIKAVMANYAEDYVNNDGLDKKAVQTLTEDFWKTYPDAHAVSKTKSIRIEGNFATVESRDFSMAASEAQGMGKGELQSVSEGQQFFKRIGTDWKIIGDRIDYEKVKLVFGLAKQLNATFTAPEQVKSGKQFSAKLEVTLPPGLRAIGSITNQPLTFPQHAPMERTRELGDQPPVLERVMPANSDNRNELLTATVILVNPSQKPMGLSILTRRLNVVPDQPETKDSTTIAHEDAEGKVASEGDKSSKASAKVESEQSDKDKASSEKSSEEKAGDEGDKSNTPPK
jgi:ketosteroid isomerase-like protein